MSDFPLLGCLHECQIVTATVGGELILEGPIYTAEKINMNGWGIPLDEAPVLARSLEGKPIRYCPQGIPLQGIPAAHYCDAKGTEQDIVGEILKVYPASIDSKDRIIYNQRARITDPATIKGIMSGEIPSSWSVFLYAKTIKDRMVHGLKGAATSIVSKPAYTEADFQWKRMAASFFTLNKPDAQNLVENIGDRVMVNEVQTPDNQAPPAAMPVGGAPQNGSAVQTTFTTGVPPVTINNYPAGTSWAGNPTATITAPAKPEAQNGEKKEPKVYSREELDAEIKAAIEKHQDEVKRTGLATDVVKLQVAAGVIDVKDEPKELEKLQILSASILEDEKAKYTKIVDAFKKASKQGEKPLSAGVIPAAAARTAEVPDGLADYLGKFMVGGKPLTVDDYVKYGRSNTRQVKS